MNNAYRCTCTRGRSVNMNLLTDIRLYVIILFQCMYLMYIPNEQTPNKACQARISVMVQVGENISHHLLRTYFFPIFT